MITSFINNAIMEWTSSAPVGEVILDPLSTLIRISTLWYQPSGTKIYIQDHALCFNTPNKYQGVTRAQKGASRHDIHVLKSTIQNAMWWYNLQHPHILFVARGAVRGLHKFSLCYNKASNLALHSIEYYTVLINSEIEKSIAAPAAHLRVSKSDSTTSLSLKQLTASKSATTTSSKAFHNSKKAWTHSHSAGISDEDVDSDEDRGTRRNVQSEEVKRRISLAAAAQVDRSSSAAHTRVKLLIDDGGGADKKDVHNGIQGNGVCEVSLLVNDTATMKKDGLDDSGAADDTEGKLKSLWTPQQLNIVHAIFLELDTQYARNNPVEVESLLESVENILRSKDKRVQEIVANAASKDVSPSTTAPFCPSLSDSCTVAVSP